MNFETPNVEITKAAPSQPEPPKKNHGDRVAHAPLPAYCRVEGVMNRRAGVGGEEFGITFDVAMPDNWNGDLSCRAEQAAMVSSWRRSD